MVLNGRRPLLAFTFCILGLERPFGFSSTHLRVAGLYLDLLKTIPTMRSIFQRLRLQASTRQDIKNYLLYALGEIILVMVGILLALQVNNWNQERVERKKELKILTDLVEEFKLNQARIEAKQQARMAIAGPLKHYLADLAAGTASYASFQTFHELNYVIGFTNPSNGVMDALISAGELTLVSNDSLKYLLADWKDQAGNLRENEQILWETTLDYNAYFQQYLLDPRQVWKDWKGDQLEVAFDLLQAKTPYRNKLIAYEACNRIVIAECEPILASIRKILALLQQEMQP